MDVVALGPARVSELIALAELNAPFVRPRSESDYWLYAELFAQTCPVAVDDGQIIGAVLGFRSQSAPSE